MAEWLERIVLCRKIGSPKLEPPKRSVGRSSITGYMWWTLDPGSPSVHQSAFAAIGIFGQWGYINPKENVVTRCLERAAEGPPSNTINDTDFFAAAVEALPDKTPLVTNHLLLFRICVVYQLRPDFAATSFVPAPPAHRTFLAAFKGSKH